MCISLWLVCHVVQLSNWQQICMIMTKDVFDGIFVPFHPFKRHIIDLRGPLLHFCRKACVLDS